MALVSLPLVVAASSLEAPGPHAVGVRDVRFVDQIFGRGEVVGRVYYPALVTGSEAPPDPAGGPYPLVAFQHGFLADPSLYDLLSAHVASHGHVVVSTGTGTGLLPDREAFALDTRGFLHWADGQSATAGSFLAGMVDATAPWAAIGHSMGGGNLFDLVGAEPRVRVLIALQAASSDADAVAAARAFDGSVLHVIGAQDQFVPAWMSTSWLVATSESAARNLAVVVEGMGHLGATDLDLPIDALPVADQRRLHRRLVTGFLRSEVRGETRWWSDLVGLGADGEPMAGFSAGRAPVLWADLVAGPGNALDVGVAARPGQLALVLAALGPGSIATPFGPLELDPASALLAGVAALGGTGIGRTTVPLAAPPAGSGPRLQALVYGADAGALTPPVEIGAPP
ncbi:MAG: hypothetical protein H6983_09150 [Ectothiorhodospiraceae bacterium]|nr:hypothetical protein [Planctomycetota bacterium]MCP5154318.1 hypothetical protein [Ectothiorhodospiraceae bacterium]